MSDFATRIAHVDMDAFFVEVERRRDPSLAGVPVIVGGGAARGVVASASYEARRHGVRSAMPTAHAKRLCPHARLVPPDHAAYSAASKEVFAVLRHFTPLVEGLSVDEAFLDIGGLRHHFASPRAVAEAIRSEVRQRTGLPASVGLSAIKFIAKMASERAKPDGLFVVQAGSEVEFLKPLPATLLWGVGQATMARLEELGIETIGDIAALPLAVLSKRVGSGLGRHLHSLANGVDDRQVVVGGEAKSISVEETYSADLVSVEAVDREIVNHADRLAVRLRSAGAKGRTVTLKIRYADFETLTRSMSFDDPVHTMHDLIEAARELVQRVPPPTRGVRLLGLAVTGLQGDTAPEQLTTDDRTWERIEDAMHEVRARFGPKAVRPATLGEAPVRGLHEESGETGRPNRDGQSAREDFPTESV